MKGILKEVSGVTCDSRSVKNGNLFIALCGYSIDSHKFIYEAIANGAKAIVAEKDFKAPKGVMKILVDDTRIALPVIADDFYDHPSKKLKMIGVTGTNGKTTITYLVENILKFAGKEPGVIGTINYRFKNKRFEAKNTTPGSLELQGLLAEMVKEGVGYAIMEVSSHSLDQGRVNEILFDIGIFTNITKEHLDYHKTVDSYFRAKAKLFDKLKKNGAAILNNDDRRVSGLKRKINNKVITYGIDKKADISAEDIDLSLNGSGFRVTTPEYALDIKTRLIGKHNVSNILAAVAAAFALGIEPKAIKEGIESFYLVPGRLEPVDEAQPFKVFVDFAHTEDALFNVLSVLREVAERKIVTVFGCGGNRDRKKRPLMARVACEFSDRVVITSDNPRLEEPQDIIKEIESGVKGRFSNYSIMVDRRRAIREAFDLARAGDIVLIAGKGHEKYQIIKDRTIPFDDCEVAREILKKGVYESKRDSKDNARKVTVG